MKSLTRPEYRRMNERRTGPVNIVMLPNSESLGAEICSIQKLGVSYSIPIKHQHLRNSATNLYLHTTF